MAVTNINDDLYVQNILVSKLSGVEGIPYQFMDNVDRRIPNTEIGRKYADKIISRIPLLFLTPCKPVFMDDFGDMDKSTVAGFLLEGNANSDLINGKGKYYSVEYDYTTYYNYLNAMLSSVAAFLGIYNEKITINRREETIGKYNWKNELNKCCILS